MPPQPTTRTGRRHQGQAQLCPRAIPGIVLAKTDLIFIYVRAFGMDCRPTDEQRREPPPQPAAWRRFDPPHATVPPPIARRPADEDRPDRDRS